MRASALAVAASGGVMAMGAIGPAGAAANARSARGIGGPGRYQTSADRPSHAVNISK